MKYLEYLESGRFEKLPVDVYVKGFLRSYAQYLGMDENYLIRLYEREKEIHNNVKKEEPKTPPWRGRPIRFSNLIITPKFLVAFLVVFFVGLGFFYLYRELSIFISNPRLAIISPGNNFSTEEKMITVEGVTEKDARLLINDQSTIVDENGKFSENLILQPGLNTITIKAINRFEKESEKVISGEARYQNIQEENDTQQDQSQGEGQGQPAEEEKKVKIDVYGDTKSALIIVKADEVEVFSGPILVGETKSFEAKEKITVSADRGKYVGVRQDGNNLGLLGKDTKPASKVITAPAVQ
jgi:cytoskeletal protein RodZ